MEDTNVQPAEEAVVETPVVEEAPQAPETPAEEVAEEGTAEVA